MEGSDASGTAHSRQARHATAPTEGVTNHGTAGSAWSGSSPAVYESAIHGRRRVACKTEHDTAGKARYGSAVRGLSRQDRRGCAGTGTTRSDLAGTDGMASPSLVALCTSRQEWLGSQSTADLARQAVHGSASSSLAKHGRRRKPFHQRERRGRSGMVFHVEDRLRIFTAGSTRHGRSAQHDDRHGRHVSARR